MQAQLSLPPEFFEALREGSRSTRIEDAQDALIAVVNDVAYEFAFDPSEIASLWMSVSERVAVSARAHPLRSIDRLREAVKNGVRSAAAATVDRRARPRRAAAIDRKVFHSWPPCRSASSCCRKKPRPR